MADELWILNRTLVDHIEAKLAEAAFHVTVYRGMNI
jgi:hypothetical protein